VSRFVKTPADLGRLVRMHREARGYATQADLADAVKTNRSAIAHLEQGLRVPEAEMLAAICEHLSMPEPLWAGYRVRKLPANQALVRCASLVYYTVYGNADHMERRRDKLVYAVKNNEPWSWNDQPADPYEHTARMMKRRFPELFQGRTFVPVPPSPANRDVPDSEWAGLRLARAFAAAGEECEAQQLVHRIKACRKSSVASNKRPTVTEQIHTLGYVGEEDGLPPGIVLVDDVITKGTTMIACAMILRERAAWLGELDGLTVGYSKKNGEKDPGEWKRFAYRWSNGAPYPERESE
jgi:transcriptional regulator with XRE-family HTH domain